MAIRWRAVKNSLRGTTCHYCPHDETTIVCLMIAIAPIVHCTVPFLNWWLYFLKQNFTMHIVERYTVPSYKVPKSIIFFIEKAFPPCIYLTVQSVRWSLCPPPLSIEGTDIRQYFCIKRLGQRWVQNLTKQKKNNLINMKFIIS